MAFVDECTVFVTSGRGGDGSSSMHSEPYKPRGGPDGGTGGAGGSVILEVRARRARSVVARRPSASEGAERAPGTLGQA